ncbi:DoxX family protein [Actinoplanes sp. CA-142083]|uniref:DoxX family protein n=1 Tax=Actinoplanes sp. CA-142083 TaxID=3239903 RepID=UPI003D936CAB
MRDEAISRGKLDQSLRSDENAGVAATALAVAAQPCQRHAGAAERARPDEKAVPVTVGEQPALIQLVCGTLVLAGLATRPAALLASGSMAYAYFTVHQPQALMPVQNGGVTPALYAWTFLIIAVMGAGQWSIDALIGHRRGMTADPVRERGLAESRR